MKNNHIKKIFSYLVPPGNWRLPVIIIFGIAAGISLHIFYASNAISYLSDDPRTCVNCHIMAPEYATWQRGSHGRVATCNDCHVPQDNIINKYLFKATDGMRHSYIFTLRAEPQVIQIKEAGKHAVQNNCIRCHQNQIHPIAMRAISNSSIADDGRYCWDCHRETPHGKVHSLSSTPYARVPLLESPTPEWIKKMVEQ
jgi:cytochrome c nitrite reductase small subunit